jgi:hypothetical protein
MIDATCDGCIYAIPLILEDGDVVEKCRRYPPVLFVLDGVVNQGSPDADKRCGEYNDGRHLYE